jgi:hypothetical protein
MKAQKTLHLAFSNFAEKDKEGGLFFRKCKIWKS